jgi:transposase-like protein
MNLFDAVERFSDQESCIEHLEHVRWGNHPQCPHCESERVAPKREGDKVGRWNCHLCKSSFNVLSGTLFQGTQIPLQKWFMAIFLMGDAKKSLSSCQLARHLDLTQQSAWYMMKRIRSEMGRTGKTLLQGIIEADETYVGGKPRRRKDKDGNLPPPSKRGRGTKKTPVIGAIERGGEVIARVATDLTQKGVLGFLQEVINPEGSELMTDEFKSYQAASDVMPHYVVNHKQKQYVNGEVHTNTIEGFWALVKRAFHGTHHHYKHVNLYMDEACYKYNNRKNKDIFNKFIRECFV